MRSRCRRGEQDQGAGKTRDAVGLLQASNEGRLPELVPLRFGRMMVSPFAFYRGAADVMAHDLAQTPATGLLGQICGDCHLLNFGGFATPERKLIFDINDFDETSIASWEWDIKRLAASFVVAGRANGFSVVDSEEAAWLTARSYQEKMAELAEMPVLKAWYSALDLRELVESGADENMKRIQRKRIAKATEFCSHAHEFYKLVHQAGDSPKIIDQPPLIYHSKDTDQEIFWKEISAVIAQYAASLSPHCQTLLQRFELRDIAVKVVGVGSVGTLCGIALFMSGNGDPLFLQFKQANRSVLEAYAGPSSYAHHGQRVVMGQRLMQAASDIFLGWTTGNAGRQFYLRQLRDAKIKPIIELMPTAQLKKYASVCGWALARSHARSMDAAVLSGYLGLSDAWPDALVRFSRDYADQTEIDHAALVSAIRSGRIEALDETETAIPS